MKKLLSIALFSAALAAQAQDARTQVIDNAGSGQYKAVVASDKTLETHTVFKPQDLSKFGKGNLLPVLVWGNGGCANSPREHMNFLNEIASHGFLVVAIGPMPGQGGPGQGGMMGMGGPGGGNSGKQLVAAIDWAEKQNADPESQYYGKIDVKNIAAAGMSCGGLQALDILEEPRLKTIMVCNSGLFNNGGVGGPGGGGAMPGMPMPAKEQLQKIHTPIIYILGGESDIAYQNGTDDYKRINHVPAFICNLPVGHGGTYMQPNGGEYGIVATAWLKWQLKGDKEAAKMFQGKDCGLSKREGWTYDKKKID